jgi:hypothetical protein
MCCGETEAKPTDAIANKQKAPKSSKAPAKNGKKKKKKVSISSEEGIPMVSCASMSR